MLSGTARNALACHHWHHEGPGPERLSEVAALGRHYVSHIHGIGPKALASIDQALALFGIAWSPIDRMPKPKPGQPQEIEREQEPADDHYWNSIVRSVGKMERDIGAALLKDHPNRDSVEGVSCRLSYLSGYIESWSECRRRERGLRDVTPEPDDQDDGEYETAGNLICLPGVKLADVQPHNGGAA